jgi:glycosyltransferase involved in cell wall biosynthesis
MINNICINARFLTQPLTGIQRCAWNIVQRLPSVRLITPKQPNAVYNSFIPLSNILILPHTFSSHLWEQFILPTAFTKQEVLWTPAGIGPVIANHHVLTINDISMIEHPEWYSKKYAIWYRLMLPYVAQKAQKIITISEFCKQRILEVMNLAENKVEVTYLGVEDSFTPQPKALTKKILANYNIPSSYILFVSSVSPRKNLSRLFEAWNIFTSHNRNTWLVIVGNTGLSFTNMITTGVLPQQTIHLSNVDDYTLVHLYAGATAFIYPSLYEGFGLPMLEAMAVGTPVITSNITSMPEIAGDAAYLINPYEVDSIVEGIERIIYDNELQENLRQKGFKQAQTFSWDRTAEETWKILQHVANLTC